MIIRKLTPDKLKTVEDRKAKFLYSETYFPRCFLVITNMPDTKHVANIAILNMARFGTEMACFRFMLNSDISLIALFIIHYNVTKKHRGNDLRVPFQKVPTKMAFHRHLPVTRDAV